MFDTLKKSLRTIYRDYFDPYGSGSMLGLVSCAVGVMLGTISLVATLGPPALLCYAIGAVCGVTGAAVSTLGGRAEAKKREEAWVPNEHGLKTHIVGPGLKVTTLVNTQEIVETLTRDLARSPTLPQDVQKKLEPWLRDAAEAAKEVQGWDISGTPVTTISFLRQVFNAQGKKTEFPVATYDLYDPAAAPAVSGAIVVPKTITLKGQQTP